MILGGGPRAAAVPLDGAVAGLLTPQPPPRPTATGPVLNETENQPSATYAARRFGAVMR